MRAKTPSLLLALAVLSLSFRVHADAATGPTEPVKLSPWARGETRGFVSTVVDVGYLYLRPRVSLGYGKPHSRWFGIETNPIIYGTGIGQYAGLRAALPYFDVRVGGRGFLSFNNAFLTPQSHYDRAAFETTLGPRSRYFSLEAQAAASFPFGPGELQGVFTETTVKGVPDGYLVYEDVMRVIVKPPTLWRARLGYSLAFGKKHAVVVGAVAEVLGVPTRDVLILRGGIVTEVIVSESLEVRGTFVPVLGSPDTIGLAGGDFAELGLRYRWATGTGL